MLLLIMVRLFQELQWESKVGILQVNKMYKFDGIMMNRKVRSKQLYLFTTKTNSSKIFPKLSNVLNRWHLLEFVET